MAYYIFSVDLEGAIEQAFSSVIGRDFFDLKTKTKVKRHTNIPNSNTDTTPIPLYRDVFVLEVKNWAEADEVLKQQAEALCEYWTEIDNYVHFYLAMTDAQSENKTKQQLDEIFAQMVV